MSKMPVAPTTASVAPLPNPPKLRNSLTSKPSVDRPDALMTVPVTRTGLTETSSICTVSAG